MISRKTCQNCKYTTEIPSPYIVVNYCGFCGLKFTLVKTEPINPGLYERVEKLEARMKTWIEFDYHKLEGRGAKLEERIEKLEDNVGSYSMEVLNKVLIKQQDKIKNLRDAIDKLEDER